jgi:hypothetical protein
MFGLRFWYFMFGASFSFWLVSIMFAVAFETVNLYYLSSIAMLMNGIWVYIEEKKHLNKEEILK